jgi:hypothetical protein
MGHAFGDLWRGAGMNAFTQSPGYFPGVDCWLREWLRAWLVDLAGPSLREKVGATQAEYGGNAFQALVGHLSDQTMLKLGNVATA